MEDGPGEVVFVEEEGDVDVVVGVAEAEVVTVVEAATMNIILDLALMMMMMTMETVLQWGVEVEDEKDTILMAVEVVVVAVTDVTDLQPPILAGGKLFYQIWHPKTMNGL